MPESAAPLETFEEFSARMHEEGLILQENDLRLLHERHVYGPGLQPDEAQPALPLAPPA